MSRPDGQVTELLAAADRDILTYRILRKEPSSPVSGELMVRLGPYAVEFRYLGVKAPDVNLAESDRAIDMMRAWCEKEINT